MTLARELDIEIVDDEQRLLYRRIAVGPLNTNCWMIATTDTRRAIVIDPGDEPARLIDAATDLTVTAVLLTHSHWDHVLAVPDVTDAWGCDPYLHPDDAPVWPNELTHLRDHGHFDAGTATADLLSCGCAPQPNAGSRLWDGQFRDLTHGQVVRLDDRAIHVLHTPGHTPGGVTLQCGRHLFTGDTLFPGGPGLTGWPLSSFATIIDSITNRLFTLPDDTHVHPGHGRSTTIGAERPHLPEWTNRGW
jgi:glyoxylase-like metal-dependent hydrolase (beta-lactamase superfamily II)